MYIYKIVDKNHFEVIGENYKSVFQGDETRAKEVIKMLEEQEKKDIRIRLKNKKNELIRLIHEKYQRKIDAMTSNYPKYEIETWPAQKEEWIRWNIDKAAPTPLVDKIAEVRGLDREELLNRIGEKVLKIFEILGHQQAEEDKIKACKTMEDLEKIQVDLNLSRN